MLNTIFRYIDELLCGLAIIIMSVLVIANVFLRYAFDLSISWAEEVATICFVWSVFLGASATYKHKMNMSIDFFVQKISRPKQPLVRLFSGFILLAINGYIFVMAVVFTKIAWAKPTAVLGVSSAVFNSALIVGFGLATIYTLRFIVQDAKQWLKRESEC